MDRKLFFAELRKSLGSFNTLQVEGIEAILDGGEIADAMVWSVPLHVRTDLRDLVERYCRGRYPSVGL